MNDNPSAVNVLYAKVESLDLQSFANETAWFLSKSNVGKEKSNNVILHMTVMNNRYRKKKPESEEHFDARGILEKYENFDFEKIHVNEAHLSVIGQQSESNKFYNAADILKF